MGSLFIRSHSCVEVFELTDIATFLGKIYFAAFYPNVYSLVIDLLEKNISIFENDVQRFVLIFFS